VALLVTQYFIKIRNKMTLLSEMNSSGVSGHRVEFFLSSYMLGAPDGKNLGAPGYSHEFVARLFKPLLERCGPVRDIRNCRRDLQPAVDDCIRRGKRPVHFSVLPFQDVTIARDALNVVMPAWEFPHVPNHAFDGNPQNDWPATANQVNLVLVSGPFTADALTRGGTTTPIRIVPVPTPDTYFEIPFWRSGSSTHVGCPAYVFDHGNGATSTSLRCNQSRLKRCEQFLRGVIPRIIGRRRYARLSTWLKDLRHAERRSGHRPMFHNLPYPKTDNLTLGGVVYTSIFNPDDGRKNWEDLLSASLAALADKEDATLVFKLIAKSNRSVRKVIDNYLGRGLEHRCRVVFICDFLTDDQMVSLCRGTTFYVQATRAEGNCLPLMNYLAAGRPGISPDHSSMGDYFDEQCGFVVESHPEPACWPHDRRLRQRTTWGRIVWPSLRDQIKASYQLARSPSEQYEQVSARCRTAMQAWASRDAVATQFMAALEELLGSLGKPSSNISPMKQVVHDVGMAA
jgi:hypothetical protein